MISEVKVCQTMSAHCITLIYEQTRLPMRLKLFPLEKPMYIVCQSWAAIVGVIRVLTIIGGDQEFQRSTKAG